MTEQKHTPEPWRVNQIEQSHASNEFGIEVIGSDGEVVADNQLYYPAAITDANARRIVACVNACAGLDTEYLESVGLPEFAGKQLCADMVQQELDIVIAQRDVLILRNVQLTQDCWSNLEAFGKAVRQRDQLRAALDRIAATKPKMMHDSNQHEVLVYQPSDNPAAIARAALAATSKS